MNNFTYQTIAIHCSYVKQSLDLSLILTIIQIPVILGKNLLIAK